MTIAEVGQKGKEYLAKMPRDVGLVALFLVGCSLSFWLGLMARGGPVAGQGSAAPALAPLSAAPVLASSTTGQVVASKNGTKYYPPNCPGAARISTSNKVWFASVDEAKAKGYQPAANCTW